MKSHRVLLLHRHNHQYRHLTGWWSYAVPEFSWDERSIDAEGFRVNLAGIEREYDLAVLDDWTFGIFDNRKLPLAYVIVDSARSDKQFKRNAEQAVYSDLILVDSDELAKFRSLNRPVRRFAHAVNEQLFYPRPKEYDVAFRRAASELSAYDLQADGGYYLFLSYLSDVDKTALPEGGMDVPVILSHSCAAK